MLFSIIAIAFFTIFKRNVVCEVFLNIFISLVGGAFLSMANALVVFYTKRKEYIISFCNEYINLIYILLEISNWYQYCEVDLVLPDEETMKYVLRRFEDISSYNYSTMLRIVDDYSSLGHSLSKTGLKLKEMMKTVENADYVSFSNNSIEFKLYGVHAYDVIYLYNCIIKPKCDELDILLNKMLILESELVKISKINDYLIRIHKDA